MKNVRMAICVVAVAWVCFFDLPKAAGVTYFEDGLTHNIDWRIEQSVYVKDSFLGGITTVNFLSDSSIKYYLFTYGSSQVIFSGGILEDSLFGYDNSQITIFGGSVAESLVQPGVDAFLYALDHSQITVFGGLVDQLIATCYSTVEISGGIVVELSTGDNSSAYISGGTITGETHASNYATITFAGSNFVFGGVNVGYGEFDTGGLNEVHATLTGTLFNGDQLNSVIYIHDNASIILIREPTHILTIDVDPNDVAIDTVTPSVGTHSCGGLVSINAQQFVKCPDVYVFDHWEGDVNDPNSANTTVFMDSDKTITGVFVVDRQCGDECHPYPSADVNKDCKVDFLDIAMVASSWLECTRPECD
jgi:hypothetical protein